MLLGRINVANKDFMLSTVDNPYDPWEQWNEWLAFDTIKGYHTSDYLARVVSLSDEISEADQELAINSAIEEIVRINPLGIYKKAYKKE